MKLFVMRAGRSDGAADIVLIHGTGANSEMWSPQLKVLEESGFRCFIPDLRGHGQTPEPEEKTDIEVHIQDLLDTLEELDIRYPATFIGHSLGAITCLLLAERRPELFSQILAVGMPGRVLGPVAKAFRIFLGWPYKTLKSLPLKKHLPWRERTLIDTPHYTLSQIVDNFATLDYLSRRFDLQCPVHFSVGRLDPVAPCQYVQEMHRMLPNSTLRIFEWAGHNCMDEQPAQFNAWMLEKIKTSAFQQSKT